MRPEADHYFSANPRTAQRPTQVDFVVGGHEFHLVAGGGVFSADRLDPGTSVLLHKAPPPDPATAGALLDLGCGYGPITCYLARVAPRATVYAVDVNARALELTRANADANGIGARVITSGPDAVPEGMAFQQIWGNPPIRVGKAELHAMLRRWLPRMAPDGVAWLVVARHLGADSLQAWLVEEGWTADRHASQRGFRVLRVARSKRNSQDARGRDQENA